MTTMATRQGIDTNTVCRTLNKHLASALDLTSQLKQAHWNITGPNFIALHELFDQQVALLRGYTDEYGERMRALGGVPTGSLRQAAELTELPDFPGGELGERDVVKALVERFEQYSKMLTDAIKESDEAGDLTTQDIYIGVQREIDRHTWFLRSHLK